mmetsp:Transcript_750/g.1977  ORF Transcript_750/g.1977 Transcript_750/m.1977 type:complete len:270 (-) Transcript_750:31-840(-)
MLVHDVPHGQHALLAEAACVLDRPPRDHDARAPRALPPRPPLPISSHVAVADDGYPHAPHERPQHALVRGGAGALGHVAAVDGEGVDPRLLQRPHQRHRLLLRLQQANLARDGQVQVPLEGPDDVGDGLGPPQQRRAHAPRRAEVLGAPAVDVEGRHIPRHHLRRAEGRRRVPHPELQHEPVPLPRGGEERPGAPPLDLGPRPVLGRPRLPVPHPLARRQLLGHHLLRPHEVRAVVQGKQPQRQVGHADHGRQHHGVAVREGTGGASPR